MEDGIRELLKENYSMLMQSITEPKILASHINVLTPMDRERIESESRERGNSSGVFELLNRLQKRGKDAFQQLIKALKLVHHTEIAYELENKALSRNLYRPNTDFTQLQTNSEVPVARGPWQTPQTERSLSYPVQPSSLNKQEPTEEKHPSKSDFDLVLHGINIPRPSDLQPNEEVNHHREAKKKDKETLLKDIPSQLKDKIVTKLNIDDALGKNWKGIAGQLQLTAEDQGQIRSLNSPMDELFKQMEYKEYRVINLVNMLLTIERLDVISVISEHGYYSQDKEDKKGLQTPTQDLEISSSDDDSAKQLEKEDGTRNSTMGLISPTQEKKEGAHRSTGDLQSPTKVSELDSPNHITKKLNEKKEGARSSTGDLHSPTKVSELDSPDHVTKKLNKKQEGAHSPTEDLQSPTKVSELDSPDHITKKLNKKKEGAHSSTGDLRSPTKVSELDSPDHVTKKLKEKKEGTHSSTGDLHSPTKVSELDSPDHVTKKLNEKKEGTQSSTVGLPSPTQVSDFDSTKMLNGKKKTHLSQEEEGGKKEAQKEPLTDMTAFEEEVFLPDTIQARAIFVTCEKYKEMNKLTKLTQQVKQLTRELEDCAWEVSWMKDRSSENMKSEVDLKLVDLNETHICFVYLAGHTIQINGENYLLPIDIEFSLPTADIMDYSVNINDLVKQLSEKALMVLVIVDGGQFIEGTFECPVALSGLASIIPPSNAVIAFPCQPGYIRDQEECLSYLKALIEVIKEEKRLAPTALFALVKEALKDSKSLPVEFSLSRSLLPIYLNASEEDEEVITIRKPVEDTPRFAVVFCDKTFEIFRKTVETGAEHLETSLRQLGWNVELCNDLEPHDIKRKVRESLKELEQDQMNVLMLYFIGYVTKDKHSIGKESGASEATHAQKISIQWLVNMMSQYVTGPKIIIVDDPSLSVRHELSAQTAIPQEFLLCLPTVNWKLRSREEKNSFTLFLAQNLATSPHSSMKTIISTSARRWKYHHVDSKLFFA